MIGRNALIVLQSLLFWQATSFVVPLAVGAGKNTALSVTRNKDSDLASRRDLFQDIAVRTFGLAGLFSLPQTAVGSGGATAGGVYLLSAKQRYNERVVAGIKVFIALAPSLESGSLAETKVFFAGDEVGTWRDSSAAGYLLANAFRTSSGTPPDRLPSVKKWRAFEEQVLAMQKALKDKKSKKVIAAYGEASTLLDDYLEAVELPPSLELK